MGNSSAKEDIQSNRVPLKTKDKPVVILKNGEINWNDPDLKNMANNSPCGYVFKDTFSCLINSKQEPKGSECLEIFAEMYECFQKYPEIYGFFDDVLKDLESKK